MTRWVLFMLRKDMSIVTQWKFSTHHKIFTFLSTTNWLRRVRYLTTRKVDLDMMCHALLIKKYCHVSCHRPSLLNLHLSSYHGLGLLSCTACSTFRCLFQPWLFVSVFCNGQASSAKSLSTWSRRLQDFNFANRFVCLHLLWTCPSVALPLHVHAFEFCSPLSSSVLLLLCLFPPHPSTLFTHNTILLLIAFKFLRFTPLLFFSFFIHFLQHTIWFQWQAFALLHMRLVMTLTTVPVTFPLVFEQTLFFHFPLFTHLFTTSFSISKRLNFPYCIHLLLSDIGQS